MTNYSRQFISNQGDNSSSLPSDRLHKILSTSLGKNNKSLDAFYELSSLSNDNSLNFRRTLRSKVEKRGIDVIKNFLKFSKHVKESLNFVHERIVKVDKTVDGCLHELYETKAKTFHLQDHTLKFIAESEKLRMEKLVLSSYLERFQLNKKEMSVLQQPEVNLEFFAALSKAHNIHSRCQMLMNCGNTSCALSIMEQLNFLQDTAMEFLYRWTRVRCKDIEFPKTSFLLSKAMKNFQNRMVLFSNLIDEYSAARRAVMVRLFIDALTKGGVNGVPKPIETYVHDKKRYVGDMLAWLRQHIPIEKEYLLLFLKECKLNKSDIQREMQRCMSNITEGVCNILAVRIEYLISSSSSPFELYDSSSLLHYYSIIISNELTDSALAKTLNELSDITESAFLNSIRNLVRYNLLEKVEAPCSDLSPTPGINYLLNFTNEILSVVGLNEGRKEFTIKIINCVIEPLLQAVNLSATKLTSIDMAVYLLNCINEISNTLSFYEFVDDWMERLQAQADAQLDTLASEQANFLVSNLNLRLMYTILQDSTKIPLSQVPGMNSNSLKCFMEKMENFIHAPGSMTIQQITFIANSAHREQVLKRSYDVIITIYKQLYSCIHDPRNLYEDPKFLMPYSPEYIQNILSLVD